MSNKKGEARLNGLLDRDLSVVNVGLETFAEDMRSCGIKATHVDWSPPAGGDPQLAALLAKLGV